MKGILLASTALVALGGQAFAADMAVKAPPATPAFPYTWTGCYVGAHIGGGWGREGFTDPTGVNFLPPGVAVNVDSRGVLGGPELGCNYQFAPNWVVGIGGDFSFADISGSSRDPFFANKNIESKTQWLASATGQVGYTLDRWMLYGKGGAAWTHDRYDTTNPVQYDFTGSETRTGWIAGAGIAWAFAPRWSAKLEYDHYGFGSGTFTLVDRNLGPQPATVKQQIEAVKFGINYRFGPFP
jgi:outer membrane immunogenic protein